MAQTIPPTSTVAGGSISTSDTGTPTPVVSDLRGGAMALVRSLVWVVDQVSRYAAAAGRARAGKGPPNPADLTEFEEAAKLALRRCTARHRDASLHLQQRDGAMHLDGMLVDPALVTGDAVLSRLRQRMLQLEIGTIQIRQWVTAGEVLAVARLLATARRPEPGAPPTDLLLSSWSTRVSTVHGDAPLAPPRITPDTEARLAAMSAARTTADAVQAAPAVVAAVHAAVQHDDAETVEAIALAALAWNRALGPGAGRLSAEWVLRELVAAPVLPLLIRRLPETRSPLALYEVLSRGGDPVARLLFERLPGDEVAYVRRAYFDAIQGTDLGGSLLVEKLRDSRWIVVRNAATLLGNMRVTGAEAALIAALGHEEERVRTAAARALLALSTPKGLRELHAAILDGSAEVRRVAAAAYGVPGSGLGGGRPETHRLVAALERERDEDVLLEMLASLGLLGSSAAVQRLVRIAMPAPEGAISSVERAAVQDSWMRVAALEALVRARGHYARNAVDSLVNDPDIEVAAAAKRLAPSVELR